MLHFFFLPQQLLPFLFLWRKGLLFPLFECLGNYGCSIGIFPLQKLGTSLYYIYLAAKTVKSLSQFTPKRASSHYHKGFGETLKIKYCFIGQKTRFFKSIQRRYSCLCTCCNNCTFKLQR